MTVVFGHPQGNPNAYNAALAHYEAGHLEVLCVPWMLSRPTSWMLENIGSLQPLAQRLSRRRFAPLDPVTKVQGRVKEICRLMARACGRDHERLAYKANDWLMYTMRREVARRRVTAIHSYEDCSLLQFAEAKRCGKACIYDMPIGYYDAWLGIQATLAHKYADWLPSSGLPSNRVRAEQKREEMKLADVVLVPSRFVAETVMEFFPQKRLKITTYGVQMSEWYPVAKPAPSDSVIFLFAGQCSLRKGIPVLLEAWRAAKLSNARLKLVGQWQLAEKKRFNLPDGATWLPPASSIGMRQYYQEADVFVLPTNFEGRALVIAEAMSCGLPVLSTLSCGADDMIDLGTGRLIPPDNLDALVEALRWFANHPELLIGMGSAARNRAAQYTWSRYRQSVRAAVVPYV